MKYEAFVTVAASKEKLRLIYSLPQFDASAYTSTYTYVNPRMPKLIFGDNMITCIRIDEFDCWTGILAEIRLFSSSVL